MINDCGFGYGNYKLGKLYQDGKEELDFISPRPANGGLPKAARTRDFVLLEIGRQACERERAKGKRRYASGS
jgi:hypothetical protein